MCFPAHLLSELTELLVLSEAQMIEGSDKSEWGTDKRRLCKRSRLLCKEVSRRSGNVVNGQTSMNGQKCEINLCPP